MHRSNTGDGTTKLRHVSVIGTLSILVGCSQGTEPSPAETTAAEPSSSSTPASASVGAGASQGAAPDASVFGPDRISSDAEEYRITFMPAGATAYFARGAGFFPQTRQATIMETTLVDGEWTEPTTAVFSGTYPDIDPWVSPDGNSLYFSSIRPVEGVERTDVEVWRVDREGDGWSDPIHLAAVGSETDELGPSVTADGVLWFASDRPDGAGGWDLYTAEPDGDGFAAPTPVDDLNTDIWEFNPAINPSGDEVIFTSIGRQDGSGLGDLFVSSRAGEDWSDEEPAPVNTPADEYHASLSPDGGTLYFVRRGVHGDLYEVEWRP